MTLPHNSDCRTSQLVGLNYISTANGSHQITATPRIFRNFGFLGHGFAKIEESEFLISGEGGIMRKVDASRLRTARGNGGRGIFPRTLNADLTHVDVSNPHKDDGNT